MITNVNHDWLPEPPPTALSLQHVEAGYEGTTVVRDLEFDVGQGGVTALLGANGSGKTTTLRVAAGLLKPSCGTVAINGVEVTVLQPHQRARLGLCMIPEGRGIFRSLTVAENLRLQIPQWVHDVGIDRALDTFPALKKYLSRPAGSLSGGEQQMIALSRAYLSAPSVVLVDEASFGLSPAMVDQVFATLRDLAAAGVALLVVEQYVHRALEIADKVVVLDKGAVLFSGTPAEMGDDLLVRTYLGATGQSTPPSRRPLAGPLTP
jgi:branched-chain amino acid transport system ATP-binding protein